MRIPAALLVALVCSFALPSLAADDAAKARQAITSQLQAFERDDADAAYEQASPAIRGMFPGAATFMAMVRGAYAPVYRHKGYEFGEARESDGKFAQTVRLTDEHGIPWDALYTLEMEENGEWKISGCVLLRAPDEAA